MNPYVISVLKKKKKSFENNRPGFKLSEDEQLENMERIYRKTSKYFNVSPDTDFNSRKRDACMVRQWTIFISKCKGYSNTQAAGFFGKDSSTAQHIVTKVINEIELYPKQKETFEYYINEESLMMVHKFLPSSKLKTWLHTYYRRYKKEMQLINADTKDRSKSDKITALISIVEELFEEEENIYEYLITSYDRDMVNKLIDKLDKIANKDKSNTSDSKHIIL